MGKQRLSDLLSHIICDLYNKIVFLFNSISFLSIHVILYVQSTRSNYVERMWTNLVLKMILMLTYLKL